MIYDLRLLYFVVLKLMGNKNIQFYFTIRYFVI